MKSYREKARRKFLVHFIVPLISIVFTIVGVTWLNLDAGTIYVLIIALASVLYLYQVFAEDKYVEYEDVWRERSRYALAITLILISIVVLSLRQIEAVFAKDNVEVIADNIIYNKDSFSVKNRKPCATKRFNVKITDDVFLGFKRRSISIKCVEVETTQELK